MTVLVVEDSKEFAHIIVSAIKGAEVVVVGTLAAAKEVLGRRAVNLVFLDLGLPDSKGLNTLRALAGFNMPKVVITGQNVSLTALAEEADDYVLKGDATEVVERVAFNVAKVARTQRPRFREEVFEEIKGYLTASRELVAI